MDQFRKKTNWPLRFLKIGALQRAVANDSHISIGPSSFSKICPSWIILKFTTSEVQASKLHFYTKFGLPGVIGYIDGTHVRIIKPTDNEAIFYNRKGYFSISALIICDFEMKIRAVNACRPGSTHESLIWRPFDARKYIKEHFENGEQTGWLLGDSGFGLERCVLTPYRNAQYRTKKHFFNKKHCSARNVVQCTTLHYKPHKVVKIINVCCALHNICKTYNIPVQNDFIQSVETEDPDNDSLNSDEQHSGRECIQIRDAIANSLTA